MSATQPFTVQIGRVDGKPVILSSTAQDRADAWLDDVRREALREDSKAAAAVIAALESLQRLAELATDERVRLDATIELLKLAKGEQIRLNQRIDMLKYHGML